jgi:hypothetical protein
MSDLIPILLVLFPLQLSEAVPLADDAIDEAEPAPAHSASNQAPVVIQTQQPRRQPPGQRQPPGGRPRTQPQQPKSRFLDGFWNVFPPPGPYTTEIGAAVGASFVETAFGGINPNMVFRGHFGLRPQPHTAPIVVYGAVDYLNYKQAAGELRYTSHYSGLMGGAGLLGYYGPLRAEATAEAGALVRVSSQTDGDTTVRKVWAQPAGGIVLGGGLAIKGRLVLSLKGSMRFYGYPVRRDVNVLYGIEYLIDARPIDYY